MKTKSILTTIFLFLAFTIQAKLPEHPCLLLTQKGIEKIKAQNKPAMLFNTTLTQIKNQIYNNCGIVNNDFNMQDRSSI